MSASFTETSRELRNLLRQSSHYGLGLLGNLALGFVSFPVFTRVFSVADYGLIDLTQKTLLFATAFSKAGLQNSALRFYDAPAFRADFEKARQYYSTMFFGVVSTAVIATAAFSAGIGLIPASFLDGPLGSILRLGAILIFLRSLQSILWSFMRIEERTKAYNLISLAMRIATFLAVCACLPWMGKSVRTYYSATIAVESAFVAAICVFLLRRGALQPGRFDRKLFLAALAFGSPLIVQEVAGVLLESGDRALVLHYLGAGSLGFYSVAYGLSNYINNFLITPLGLAILPIYMRIWTAEGPEKTVAFLSDALDWFLMAGFCVLAVASLAAHDAVLLLASPKYRGADQLMPLIVAGLLLYTTHVFLNAGLVIYKQTRRMAMILGWSAVVNITLNCLLLPRIGLRAAALASLIGYATCIGLLLRVSGKTMRLRIRAAAVVRYSVVAIVTFLAVSHLDFRSSFWNTFGKASLGTLVYVVLMLVLDQRVRTLARRVLHRSAAREAAMAA
jgi:O-antigen/teichoic acid export membrane protein